MLYKINFVVKVFYQCLFSRRGRGGFSEISPPLLGGSGLSKNPSIPHPFLRLSFYLPISFLFPFTKLFICYSSLLEERQVFFLQYAFHPVKVQGGPLWATKNPFHPGHLMSFFLTSGFLSLFPFYNFFSFLRVDRARQPGMVACLGEGDPDFKPPVLLRNDRFCKIIPLLFLVFRAVKKSHFFPPFLCLYFCLPPSFFIPLSQTPG